MSEVAYSSTVTFQFAPNHWLRFENVSDDTVHAWEHEIDQQKTFRVVYGPKTYTINAKKVEYMKAWRRPSE